MFRPFAALAMLACASLLAAPASALAQDPAAEVPDVAVSAPQAVTTGPSYGVAKASSTPELWATVNICDTQGHPDAMGVRASMPGNGTRQRMYMRFTAEYWSRARQAWTPVAGTGVSRWVYAGTAEYARRQAGWTFAFSSPPQGVTFTMRSQVEFEWRAEPALVAKRGLKRSRRAHGRSKHLRRAHRRAKRGAKHLRRAHGRARRGAGRLRSRGHSKRGPRAHWRTQRGRPHERAGGRSQGRLRAQASRERVVRSVVRATQTGVAGVDGGDPAGTSKALCLIY